MHGKLPMMRAKSTSISSETLSTFTGVSNAARCKKSFAGGLCGHVAGATRPSAGAPGCGGGSAPLALLSLRGVGGLLVFVP